MGLIGFPEISVRKENLRNLSLAGHTELNKGKQRVVYLTSLSEWMVGRRQSVVIKVSMLISSTKDRVVEIHDHPRPRT